MEVIVEEDLKDSDQAVCGQCRDQLVRVEAFKKQYDELKASIKTVINPRPEGYGTCSVIRSFVHSFCPSSCRDERSFLRAGKVMSMTSSTMACNLTRRFC